VVAATVNVVVAAPRTMETTSKGVGTWTVGRTVFVVLEDGAIGGKHLAHHLDNLFEVQVRGQALDRRQALAAIALLAADVDHLLFGHGAAGGF